MMYNHNLPSYKIHQVTWVLKYFNPPTLGGQRFKHADLVLVLISVTL